MRTMWRTSYHVIRTSRPILARAASRVQCRAEPGAGLPGLGRGLVSEDVRRRQFATVLDRVVVRMRDVIGTVVAPSVDVAPRVAATPAMHAATSRPSNPHHVGRPLSAHTGDERLDPLRADPPPIDDG